MNPRRPASASSSSVFPSLSELLELCRFTPSADALPERAPRGPDRSPALALTALTFSSGALVAGLSHSPPEAAVCADTRAGELSAHSAALSAHVTHLRPTEALREVSIALGFRAHPSATPTVTETQIPSPGAMPVTTSVPPIPQAQTPVETPTGSLGPDTHTSMRRGGVRRTTSHSPELTDSHRPHRNR